jgi:hypothetical protein
MTSQDAKRESVRIWEAWEIAEMVQLFKAGPMRFVDYSKFLNLSAENYEQILALQKENEELREKISYLPKVPTSSYEKEMAKEIISLQSRLDLAKRALDNIMNAYGDPHSDDYATAEARECLDKLEGKC